MQKEVKAASSVRIVCGLIYSYLCWDPVQSHLLVLTLMVALPQIDGVYQGKYPRH